MFKNAKSNYKDKSQSQFILCKLTLAYQKLSRTLLPPKKFCNKEKALQLKLKIHSQHLKIKHFFIKYIEHHAELQVGDRTRV